MAFSALRSLFTDSPGNPSVMGAIGDPQFRQEVAGNARDASIRGAVAGALGAPVDMANSIANLGTAAYGYLGNKMGMLSGSEMPPLYVNPVGGSEWIGNKMQEAGIIGGNRNPYAEAAASIGFPMVGGAMEARIPQMDRALARAGENLAANGGMNTGQYMGQRGAVGAAGDPKLMEEVRRRGLDISQGVSQAVRNENLARFKEGSVTPQTLYHATPADFEIFKPGGNDMSLSGRAIYLTDNALEQHAAHNIGGYKGQYKEGTNVMPLHANISKPLIVTNENLRELQQKYGSGFPRIIPRENAYDIMDDGFDGVITRDIANGEIPAEYVVFDSTQLKSAIGNKGTYDPANPNIMAGVAGGTVGLSALRNINNDEQPSK